MRNFKRLFLFGLFAIGAWLLGGSAFAATINVPATGSIQAGIDAASTGDTVLIANGTYNPTSTITVDKGITLQGQSKNGVIIDASGHSGYGIRVKADDVKLKKFTLQNTKHYGIKVNKSSGYLTNFVVRNIIVKNSAKTNLDLNGVDGATIAKSSFLGSSRGNGITLSNSKNVDVKQNTTQGNVRGSLAIYSANGSGYPTSAGSSSNKVKNHSFSEDLGLYTQETDGTVDDTTAEQFTCTVTSDNTDVRPDIEEFIYYFETRAEGEAFGDSYLQGQYEIDCGPATIEVTKWICPENTVVDDDWIPDENGEFAADTSNCEVAEGYGFAYDTEHTQTPTDSTYIPEEFHIWGTTDASGKMSIDVEEGRYMVGETFDGEWIAHEDMLGTLCSTSYYETTHNNNIEVVDTVGGETTYCNVVNPKEPEPVPVAYPECEDANMYASVILDDDSPYDGSEGMYYGDQVLTPNTWFEIDGPVSSSQTEGFVVTYDGTTLRAELLHFPDNQRRDIHGTIEFYGVSYSNVQEIDTENTEDDFSANGPNNIDFRFYLTNADDAGSAELEYNEVVCEEEPETAKIIAHKIICQDEADLPNWGNGGPDITASTAQDRVAQHDGCRLASDWEFEWAPKNSNAPAGDHVGPAGGNWTTFGPTDGSGMAMTTIADITEYSRLEMREVLQDEYIPFSDDDQDAYSAEFYCHTDVANYDNEEWINNPEVDATYYCVAWNHASYCPDDTYFTNYAVSVVDKDQGKKKNGNAVDADRSDANDALFAPDGDFYTLGFGGWIEVAFGAPVYNQTGGDISIHEITNGRANYPEETAFVEVSKDGSTRYSLGTVSSSSAVSYLDLSTAGLDWIQYVRVIDTTDGSLHDGVADGFELDAVDAVYACTPFEGGEEPEGPICGNGEIEPGETVPEFTINTFIFDTPESFCIGEGCLELPSGEECDDGNTTNGDGCNEYCELEEDCEIIDNQIVCEQEPVTPEQCDDNYYGELSYNDGNPVIFNFADGYDDGVISIQANGSGGYMFDFYATKDDHSAMEVEGTLSLINAQIASMDRAYTSGFKLEHHNVQYDAVFGEAGSGAVEFRLQITANGQNRDQFDFTLQDDPVCEDEGGNPICGDGEVNQEWEQCDDGNTQNGDGCDNECQEEEPVCTTQMMHIVSDGDAQWTVDGDTPYAVDTREHKNWTQQLSGVADWIWSEAQVSNPSEAETHTFAKTFDISGSVLTGIVRIAVDNTYTLTVNGSGVATVGGDNYASTTSYDVTAYLQDGTNTISVEVTNAAAGNNSTYKSNPAGFVLDLAIDYEVCEDDENEGGEGEGGSTPQGRSTGGGGGSSSTPTTVSTGPNDEDPTELLLAGPDGSVDPADVPACNEDDYILERFVRLQLLDYPTVYVVPADMLRKLGFQAIIKVRELVTNLEKMDEAEANDVIRDLVCDIELMKAERGLRHENIGYPDDKTDPTDYLYQYTQDLAILQFHPEIVEDL